MSALPAMSPDEKEELRRQIRAAIAAGSWTYATFARAVDCAMSGVHGFASGKSVSPAMAGRFREVLAKGPEAYPEAADTRSRSLAASKRKELTAQLRRVVDDDHGGNLPKAARALKLTTAHLRGFLDGRMPSRKDAVRLYDETVCDDVPPKRETARRVVPDRAARESAHLTAGGLVAQWESRALKFLLNHHQQGKR